MYALLSDQNAYSKGSLLTQEAPPSYTDFPQQHVYPDYQDNMEYQDPANPTGPVVGYPHPGTQVHVQLPGPAIVIQPLVGPQPTRTTCPHCNSEAVTRVDRRSAMRTHNMALLLCIFGCWPCVFIPYCMDSCLDAHHYCIQCDAYIGTYSR